MNKKYFLVGILLLLCSVCVFGLSYSKQQFSSFSNSTIATYMINNMMINDVYVDGNILVVDYNITHVSFNKRTNFVDVFNVNSATYLSGNDINWCLSKYSLNICVTYLVNVNGVYYYNTTLNGIFTTVTLPSTLHQAYDKGILQYNYAVSLRDNIITELQYQNNVNVFKNSINISN